MRPTLFLLIPLLTAGAAGAAPHEDNPVSQSDEQSDDAQTREVLREHGLPAGLLPDGIQHADITSDGRFHVVYPRPVERTHGGYPVKYDREISGVLDQGVVRELSGVHARKFVWIPVGRITAVDAGLTFFVGPATRTLPLSEFPFSD